MPRPLLVPCDDPEAAGAALRAGADMVVLDLGDAGAAGDRAARRATALHALRLFRTAHGDGSRSRATPTASPVHALPDSHICSRGRSRPSPLWGEGPRQGDEGSWGPPEPLIRRFAPPSPQRGEGRNLPAPETCEYRRVHAGEETPSGSTGPVLVVRVAPLASGLVDGDLDAVMAGAPDAVLLPGAVGLRGVGHLAAKLAVREAECGLPAGRTRVVAMAADTAAGVLALAALPGAGPRLLALGWDAAALAAALGVAADASPVRHARDLLLIAAAAAGIPALDVGLAADDLAAACRTARRDGFAGRVARRPEELAVIRSVFGARRP